MHSLDRIPINFESRHVNMEKIVIETGKILPMAYFKILPMHMRAYAIAYNFQIVKKNLISFQLNKKEKSGKTQVKCRKNTRKTKKPQ